MGQAHRNLLDLLSRTGWDGRQMIDAALREAADDRAHAEAEKLRQRGEELKIRAGSQGIGMAMAATLIVEAVAMDPYEMRDGQLVRKSDGSPVT